MATSTQIDNGLDEIAAYIVQVRANMNKSKSFAASSKTGLDGLPAQYADLMSTINALPGGEVSEDLAKSRLAKYTTEFLALSAKVDTAHAALSPINFDN